MALFIPVPGARRNQGTVLRRRRYRPLKRLQVITVPPIVSVEPGDPRTAAFSKASVNGAGEPPVLRQRENSKAMLAGIFLEDPCGVVCAAVIYDNYFICLTCLFQNRTQRQGDGSLRIVHRHQHRYLAG